MEIFEYRTKSYHKDFLLDLEKRSRESFAISLRKSKRFETTNKKRVQNDSLPSENFPEFLYLSYPSLSTLTNSEKFLILNHHLKNSLDKAEIFSILSYLRSLTCKSFALELFFSHDFINTLIKYINQKYEIPIIEQASWILCNLTSGPSHCVENLFQNNIIEIFFNLLDYPSQKTQENALWGLSNIIIDDVKYLKVIADYGVIRKIKKICKINNPPEVISLISTLIRSVCNEIQIFEDHAKKELLMILEKLLNSEGDEISKNCLWSVSLIIRENVQLIDELFGEGIDRQVLTLCHKFPIEALWVVGNIARGKRCHIEALINDGVLDTLHTFLSSKDEDVVAETFWVLSNFVTGGYRIICRIKSHSIFNTSMASLHVLPKIAYARAGLYVKNLLKLSNNSLQMQIIDSGAINALSKIPNGACANFLFTLLEIFEVIIDIIGNQSFHEQGYHDIVNELIKNKNEEVSSKAISIANLDLEMNEA